MSVPGCQARWAPVLSLASCLLLLALLFSLTTARQSMPMCCRQKTCPCRVYDLLHGLGNHATGILTLGKRKSSSQAFQSQLYRLLHGAGSHASGILTMGKRAAWIPSSCLCCAAAPAPLAPAPQSIHAPATPCAD
uniref:Hypocretin neuropeptide precursor n=1 Tax=Pelusios castaneus TaxID=367368 RepID=A0A8C8RCR0_9SAUR